MKLDLGCGPAPLDGYLGIDLHSAPKTEQHAGVLAFRLDMGESWPFEDGSIEALHSSHCIEHLDARSVQGKDVLTHFFEEAWRVAVPGAPFILRWPSLIDEKTGKWLTAPFWDPTHRRFIPREQLEYFSIEGRRNLGVEHYRTACNWVVTQLVQRPLNEARTVFEYFCTLRKEPMP